MNVEERGDTRKVHNAPSFAARRCIVLAAAK